MRLCDTGVHIWRSTTRYGTWQKNLTVEVIIILCWEMNVNNCLDSDMEDIGQIESIMLQMMKKLALVVQQVHCVCQQQPVCWVESYWAAVCPSNKQYLPSSQPHSVFTAWQDTHCKSKIVALANVWVTTVVWNSFPSQCTWVNFTSPPVNILCVLHSLNYSMGKEVSTVEGHSLPMVIQRRQYNEWEAW